MNFSRPGEPTDNAFIESFNGTFRDECLNAHWFETLSDAKIQIEQWRQEYNKSRPHRALGEIPPAEFARQHPPAHLLPQMAKLLGVSADALLGTTPPKRMKALATNRLERRLMEIEKLDASDKRQVLQIIDAFIEKGQLRRKCNERRSLD